VAFENVVVNLFGEVAWRQDTDIVKAHLANLSHP